MMLSNIRSSHIGGRLILYFIFLSIFSYFATGPTYAAYYDNVGKATGTGGGIGEPGLILSPVRNVLGKNECGKKNDRPKKSDHNSRGHIDSECCLDPDETPNSNCYYSSQRYQKYINKYLAAKNK